MIEKLCEFASFPIFKIKLGRDNDLEIIRSLRAETESVFRVDANCGWTVQETIEKSPELASLGVEFIEQPLPRDQLEAMDASNDSVTRVWYRRSPPTRRA